MALFNYAAKEITIKIVYYGPGLSGKTTNLRYLHAILDPSKRGKLLCLSTETDRTLFFDLLPVELGKIRDFSIRIQLYTVPGQVMYNATRRLVLKGADAVVFVADSQREIREQNVESLKNMRENLIANDINPDDIPLVFQYNKRDLTNVLSIDELENDLNEDGRYQFIESIAIDGVGVEDTLRLITKFVVNDIAKKQRVSLEPLEEAARPPEEEIAPVTVGTIESTYEDFLTTGPIIEPTVGEPIEMGKGGYGTLDPEKGFTPTLEEETPPPKEVITETDREATVAIVEKLDMIIKSSKELSDILKEIHSGIRETAREQREANLLLRDIRKHLERRKKRKSWFGFLRSGS